MGPRVSSWVVPGYAEERQLGSGASGRVVAAVHVSSETRVAIKYLSPGLLGDPRFVAGFRAEARLLRSLADPHVVRLVDYVEAPGPAAGAVTAGVDRGSPPGAVTAGVDRGSPPGAIRGAAIVMELVDGVSLHEMITSQGPAGAEAALVVLKGSLLGLAAAHALGIVHRDYKPENVLVDAEGTSKLTDFGIAVHSGQDAPAGGTPYYMAPEQWNGSPATPAGDIYAATAVFFECLTGMTPFSGGLVQLAAQHAAAAVPVAMVDEPLRALIARGMAKDPAVRPASAGAFVSELETAAAAACGPDWESRGRAQLAGRAAALLLLLVHGSTATATATAAGGSGSATVTTTLASKAGAVSLHSGLSGWQVAAAAAAFVVVSGAVAGAVVGVGGLVSSKHPVASSRPAAASSRPAAAAALAVPSLVYATATSVDLRSANGTVKALATFPKSTGFTSGGLGPGRLAWSADGSKVAWLANGEAGELIVSQGQVHEWRCNCSSIAFQGNQLVSDDYTAENSPRLLSYPDDGSKPVPIAISGLPKSSVPTAINSFTLDAAITPDDVIVGYGTEVAAAGGPQLLYRVNATGQAVLFAPAASQVTSNGVPAGFTFSPDGSQVGFLEFGQGGVCADTEFAVVASTASGAETHPPMPAGIATAVATWFGPSGTVYASMAPEPPGCAHVGQGTVPDVVTTAQDYRLQGGAWVRSGSGIISQAPARGGWEATLYGTVDSTELGASPASASLRLVLTDGATSVAIPGVQAFMWAS